MSTTKNARSFHAIRRPHVGYSCPLGVIINGSNWLVKRLLAGKLSLYRLTAEGVFDSLFCCVFLRPPLNWILLPLYKGVDGSLFAWGQLSMRKERMKGRGHGGQVAISSFHYLTSLKLDWIATPADNQSLVKFYQNAIYNVHKRRIRKRARSAGSGTMA